MQRRRKTPSTAFQASSGNEGGSKSTDGEDSQINLHLGKPRRSSYVWLTLFVMIAYCCSAIYTHQFGNMPEPLTAEQAGKRGFSEIEALKHVKALTELGPHPVASETLDSALQVGSWTQIILANIDTFFLISSHYLVELGQVEGTVLLLMPYFSFHLTIFPCTDSCY